MPYLDHFTCLSCQSHEFSLLLNVPAQAMGNFYLKRSDESAPNFPLQLSLCKNCGLIQLATAPPVEFIKSPYDWIVMNEPEGHLDEVVQNYLLPLRSSFPTRTLSISYKDQTLAARLQNFGFEYFYTLDLSRDFGVADKNASLETLQAMVTSQTCEQLAKSIGQFDFVLVRHILEHARNPVEFLKGVQEFLKPGGYVLFELPDCSKPLEYYDYSMIWEEHITYFTPLSFRNILNKTSLNIRDLKIFPYTNEDSLVCIAQIDKTNEPIPSATRIQSLEYNIQRALNYSNDFEDKREALDRYLAHFRANRGKIAIFGAGHCSGTFVDLMGIKKYIEYFVDDHPNKQGLYMPGSKLPIVNSKRILSDGIQLCLLGLSPESETKVIQNQQAFLKTGGKFISIYPASNYSINGSII